jgi:hypothetical protein
MVLYFQEEEGFPHKELCVASSATNTTTLKGKIMKLISKEMKINTDTFQPEMIVTIAVPIEAMMDAQRFVGENEFFQIIGKEFCESISLVKE